MKIKKIDRISNTKSINDALLYAAFHGSIDECVKLVQRGADINVISQNHAYECGVMDGITPFLVAVQQGHFELVKFLSENMIIQEVPGEKCNCCEFVAPKEVRHQADIYFTANTEIYFDEGKTMGFNALILSVIMLSEYNYFHLANPNKTDKDWLTIINFLIGKGFDINDENLDGNTALFFVGNDKDEIDKVSLAKYLIAHGADVNHLNKNNETAVTFLFGRTYYSDRLFNYYFSLENVSKDAALVQASIYGQDEFDLLLDKGANPAAFNSKSLITALDHGKYDLAITLIKNGAEIETKNNNGDTAIICASQYGSLESIKVLLGYGANINAKNNKGNTALVIAKQQGYTNVVTLLENALEKQQLLASIMSGSVELDANLVLPF